MLWYFQMYSKVNVQNIPKWFSFPIFFFRGASSASASVCSAKVSRGSLFVNSFHSVPAKTMYNHVVETCPLEMCSKSINRLVLKRFEDIGAHSLFYVEVVAEPSEPVPASAVLSTELANERALMAWTELCLCHIMSCQCVHCLSVYRLHINDMYLHPYFLQSDEAVSSRSPFCEMQVLIFCRLNVWAMMTQDTNKLRNFKNVAAETRLDPKLVLTCSDARHLWCNTPDIFCSLLDSNKVLLRLSASCLG